MINLTNYKGQPLPFLINVLANEHITNKNFGNQLVGAFTWEDTPQGDKFWRDIVRMNYERFNKRYPFAQLYFDRGGVELLRVYYKLVQ